MGAGNVTQSNASNRGGFTSDLDTSLQILSNVSDLFDSNGKSSRHFDSGGLRSDGNSDPISVPFSSSDPIQSGLYGNDSGNNNGYFDW